MWHDQVKTLMNEWMLWLKFCFELHYSLVLICYNYWICNVTDHLGEINLSLFTTAPSLKTLRSINAWVHWLVTLIYGDVSFKHNLNSLNVVYNLNCVHLSLSRFQHNWFWDNKGGGGFKTGTVSSEGRTLVRTCIRRVAVSAYELLDTR